MEKYLEDKKDMVWKTVRKWVKGYYYWRDGKRIHVKGHYRYVEIWVPKRW